MIKLCKKFVAAIAISMVSITANAGIIKFNGGEVNALDLNGVAPSFIDFYELRNDSAHTGLEMDSTIIMFLAELNGVYAVYTIANKADSNGASGLFKTIISASSGMVELLDDPEDLSIGNLLKFDYAPKKTDGFIFKIEAEEFEFTQTISSPNERYAAVGVAGVRFIDFEDGTLGSASYSQELIAFGDFSITRTVSAPSTLILLTLTGLGYMMRKRLETVKS